MFNNLRMTLLSSAAASAQYTGAFGELSFDWESCSLRIHDGATCGGKVLNPAATPFDPSALEEAITELQARNPVVDLEVIAGSSDIVVTYLDGATETVDLPEFGATTDANGLITFDLNGTTFGPFDTGAHAVDTDTDTFSAPVDNNDGTVTVTYANGSVHTYATGPQTVDTVVTYSYVWAADGAVTITGSDGSTFTGPPNTIDTDTDTDTFATLSGQTITFANGDTLTVPSAASPDTVTRLTDGRILHTATDGTTFATPLDRTEGGLDDLAIPIAQHGLSAGQVALGYNSNGVGAPAVSLWNSIKAISYSVAPRSIVSALYNSAFFGGIAGIVGIRNRDGSFGHYNRLVPTLAVAIAENNGAFTSLNIGGGNRFGDVFQFPDGRYEGQIVRVNIGGLDVFQAVLEGNFRGVVREPLGGKIERQSTVTQIGIRPTEQLHATWHNGRWHVIIEHGTASGADWREESDGTLTTWGTGAAAAFPFPVANAAYFTTGPSSAKTVTGFQNDDGGDWQAFAITPDYGQF